MLIYLPAWRSWFWDPQHREIATLYATTGLLVAAIAQAVVAGFQAFTAKRQARAADKQADAAQNAILLSVRQMHFAILSADNSTMPLISIGWSSEAAQVKTLIVRNGGLGPAQHVYAARFDPQTRRGDEGFKSELGVLAIGGSMEFEWSMSDLEGPGVLFHFESSHNTIVEKLVKTTGDFLRVTDLRIERPYDKLIEAGNPGAFHSPGVHPPQS
jgi:hypothetical protein